MSALQIINEILHGIPQVKDVVANRIYPGDAPQAIEGSYIVTNLTSAVDASLITGPGKYWRHRITINICSDKMMIASDLGEVLMDKLPDVIKQKIGGFKDVDIHFADVDFTQSNDARTAYMRTQQFFVRWRT